MPIISAIKPQKNLTVRAGNKRVNIYLDNEFAFGLDLENFVKFNLKVDQELDEDQIQLIKDTGEQQKIFDKVLRFAMIRPRSEKEIKDYFKRKKFSSLVYGYVFDKLKEFKLLNDLEFAKWWVEMRLAQSRSQRSMIYDLRSKGINSEIIKQVLENTEIDELKLAKELIKNKMYKWERFDPKIRKQKISQYLAGKGFNWDVISEVVK